MKQARRFEVPFHLGRDGQRVRILRDTLIALKNGEYIEIIQDEKGIPERIYHVIPEEKEDHAFSLS